MAAAGTATYETLNLVTDPTVYSAYVWIGGIGCTLPLVIMLVFAKSNKLRALGRASLVPAIFNINEPVVFGCIAWNPIMMIPMWLMGIILPSVVWIFTKVIPFAPIPTRVLSVSYFYLADNGKYPGDYFNGCLCFAFHRNLVSIFPYL